MNSKQELEMYLKNIREILISNHGPTKQDLMPEITIITDLIKHTDKIDSILKEETKDTFAKITATTICMACGGHKTNPDYSHHICQACNGEGTVEKTLDVTKFKIEY